MIKQFFVTFIFISVFVSVVLAQKNNSKNETRPIPTPQISLDKKLEGLSEAISGGLADNQKTTVAVADFVDLNGKSSDFGKFLAEELITRLFITKKLKVVERQRLDKVIAEQKLSLTEIIEVASAKKIGRILGVDAIVAGTISELGDNFRINARIISTETGELLAAAGATVFKDQEVCSLINCDKNKTSVVNSSEDQKNTNTFEKKGKNGIPGVVSSSNLKPLPTEESWIADADFYTFEIQKCRISGTAIICEFTITNNDKDRRIGISSESVIFDDSNNRYGVNAITLANANSSGSVYVYLVAGVKTKGRIEFKGVSTEATKITLLEIPYYLGGGNRSSVKFRDIPLR